MCLVKERFFNNNQYGITSFSMYYDKGKYRADVHYQDKHLVTQTLDNIDAVMLTNTEDESKLLELLW